MKRASPDKAVRPVIVFPYTIPRSATSFQSLIAMIKELVDSGLCRPPLAVLNHQTEARATGAASAVLTAMRSAVTQLGGTVDVVWATDTCGLWEQGLGASFLAATLAGQEQDTFWLIPGDFDFLAEPGKRALSRMPEIPKAVHSGRVELALGEITVAPDSVKQLIDTYGTYGLLYCWFPTEARGIRRYTSKPRSEFFAIGYNLLKAALYDHRWFAYEQTVNLLLQCMDGRDQRRKFAVIDLGEVIDDAYGRADVNGALQQIERTERLLKVLWRERAVRTDMKDWPQEYGKLDQQSRAITSAALVVMREQLP